MSLQDYGNEMKPTGGHEDYKWFQKKSAKESKGSKGVESKGASDTKKKGFFAGIKAWLYKDTREMNDNFNKLDSYISTIEKVEGIVQQSKSDKTGGFLRNWRDKNKEEREGKIENLKSKITEIAKLHEENDNESAAIKLLRQDYENITVDVANRTIRKRWHNILTSEDKFREKRRDYIAGKGFNLSWKTPKAPDNEGKQTSNVTQESRKSNEFRPDEVASTPVIEKNVSGSDEDEDKKFLGGLREVEDQTKSRSIKELRDVLIVSSESVVDETVESGEGSTEVELTTNLDVDGLGISEGNDQTNKPVELEQHAINEPVESSVAVDYNSGILNDQLKVKKKATESDLHELHDLLLADLPKLSIDNPFTESAVSIRDNLEKIDNDSLDWKTKLKEFHNIVELANSFSKSVEQPIEKRLEILLKKEEAILAKKELTPKDKAELEVIGEFKSVLKELKNSTINKEGELDKLIRRVPIVLDGLTDKILESKANGKLQELDTVRDDLHSIETRLNNAEERMELLQGRMSKLGLKTLTSTQEQNESITYMRKEVQRVNESLNLVEDKKLGKIVEDAGNDVERLEEQLTEMEKEINDLERAIREKIKGLRSELAEDIQTAYIEDDQRAMLQREFDTIPEEIEKGNEDIYINSLLGLEKMLGKPEIPIEAVETTDTTLSKITDYEKSIKLKMEDVKSLGKESFVYKTQMAYLNKLTADLTKFREQLDEDPDSELPKLNLYAPEYVGAILTAIEEYVKKSEEFIQFTIDELTELKDNVLLEEEGISPLSLKLEDQIESFKVEVDSFIKELNSCFEVVDVKEGDTLHAVVKIKDEIALRLAEEKGEVGLDFLSNRSKDLIEDIKEEKLKTNQ